VLGAQAAALIEALPEPAFVVARDGMIICANRAAERILKTTVVQQPLSNLIVGEPDALALYLERCFGAGQPLIGRLALRTMGESRDFQSKGCAFPVDGDRLILLRLSDSGDQPFAALTRTVAELKAELQKRQRSEAMLEEAVRERELLLRELEHRVKNNMQMLAAMLIGAEREASSDEAKAALKDASLRFSAVSAVQQLLYRSDALATINSEALVSTLVRAVSTIAPQPITTEVLVEPIELPIDSAVPIGLTLNELLTNAVKYGRPSGGPQMVRVDFNRKANQIEIIVKDNGPGFDLSESRKRASGIGLVRGLLRQLGGSIRVERDDGARCIITLPDPSHLTSRSYQ
jgi:two-component sensor histidine kinase